MFSQFSQKLHSPLISHHSLINLVMIEDRMIMLQLLSVAKTEYNFYFHALKRLFIPLLAME